MVKASQYFLEKIRDHLGDENIQLITEEGYFPEMIIRTAKKSMPI